MLIRFFYQFFFDEPFELYDDNYEIDIGSVPAVDTVLIKLSEVLSFDLHGEFEEEYSGGKWHPLSTVRNVGRILYLFF